MKSDTSNINYAKRKQAVQRTSQICRQRRQQFTTIAIYLCTIRGPESHHDTYVPLATDLVVEHGGQQLDVGQVRFDAGDGGVDELPTARLRLPDVPLGVKHL